MQRLFLTHSFNFVLVEKKLFSHFKWSQKLQVSDRLWRNHRLRSLTPFLIFWSNPEYIIWSCFNNFLACFSRLSGALISSSRLAVAFSASSVNLGKSHRNQARYDMPSIKHDSFWFLNQTLQLFVNVDKASQENLYFQLKLESRKTLENSASMIKIEDVQGRGPSLEIKNKLF